MALVQVLTHRFTVDEYHQMARAGILREDDRVELIDGEIVDMSPIGREHQAAVDVLNYRLTAGLGLRAIVRVQGSIRLGLHSEPEPDLVLLRPRASFYRDIDASPGDVLLLIEVSDASLDYDRTVKLPRYALAGISEAWVVNLPAGQVEVYRSPTPDGYREVQRFPRGGRLAPAAFPDLSLAVDEIVG
jgi:Uma2 family endonuclease